MRFSSFLIIIFILGACSYSSSNTPSEISPSVEIEHSPRSISTTTTPISTLEEEEKTQEQKSADRAFEDGLPLAARVNGQPIFLETYEKQVTQYEQTLKAQGVDLASDAGQANLAQIQKQILEGLLEQQIIEQQAPNLGVIITGEEVEAKAQENIAQLQNQAQFEEWLANNDLTYQEFLANLQSQLLANKVFENVTRDVPEVADQIQLRYIRVEAEATAQTIIERLKIGESFATLSQQYSLAEDTEDNLSWFPKDAALFPGEVETIAFSLQPGQVSGPIETSLGFYIIKLENKEVDRALTPDMLQILKKQIFDDWLKELRLSTAIEIYVES